MSVSRILTENAIEIDFPNRKIDAKLSDTEIERRLETFKPIEKEIPAGFMRRYIKQVSSAARGAILE